MNTRTVFQSQAKVLGHIFGVANDGSLAMLNEREESFVDELANGMRVYRVQITREFGMRNLAERETRVEDRIYKIDFPGGVSLAMTDGGNLLCTLNGEKVVETIWDDGGVDVMAVLDGKLSMMHPPPEPTE